MHSAPGMPTDFRRALRLLWWEGAFALAYETFTNSNYVIGLAGELGVGLGTVMVLTALPWVGSLGQALGIVMLTRANSMKRYTLAVAAAARAVWLIPYGIAAYWGMRAYASAAKFPTERWFLIYALTAGVSALLSSSSVAAWNSWMRALIPRGFQGRFFGLRQRFMTLAIMLANLLVAAWIGLRVDGYYTGYAALVALGLLGAFASTWILARVPEPSVRSVRSFSSAPPASLRETLREPFRDAAFRELLLFGASFQFAAVLAGPYFTYFFTHDLKLPLSLVATWGIIANLGCVLASAMWGKRVDRAGVGRFGRRVAHGPHAVLWLCGHLIAVSPLFYLFPSATIVRFVAPPEFFVNGIAWVGYQIALAALLFARCPPGRNSSYFSVFAAVTGLFAAIGTALGGWLAQVFAGWVPASAGGGFPLLWALASMLRLAVLWIFLNPMRLAALDEPSRRSPR